MPKFTLFHGTKLDAATPIGLSGFKITQTPAAGRSFGNGLYATDDFKVAARHGAMFKNENRANGNMYSIIELQANIEEDKILRHNLTIEDKLAVVYHESKATEDHVYTPEHNPNRESRIFANEAMYGKAFAQELSQILEDDPEGISVATGHITQAAKQNGKSLIIYDYGDGETPPIYVFLNPEKDLKVSNTHVLATPEVDPLWHQKVDQLSDHLKK